MTDFSNVFTVDVIGRIKKVGPVIAESIIGIAGSLTALAEYNADLLVLMVSEEGFDEDAAKVIIAWAKGQVKAASSANSKADNPAGGSAMDEVVRREQEATMIKRIEGMAGLEALRIAYNTDPAVAAKMLADGYDPQDPHNLAAAVLRAFQEGGFARLQVVVMNNDFVYQPEAQVQFILQELVSGDWQGGDFWTNPFAQSTTYRVGFVGDGSGKVTRYIDPLSKAKQYLHKGQFVNADKTIQLRTPDGVPTLSLEIQNVLHLAVQHGKLAIPGDLALIKLMVLRQVSWQDVRDLISFNDGGLLAQIQEWHEKDSWPTLAELVAPNQPMLVKKTSVAEPPAQSNLQMLYLEVWGLLNAFGAKFSQAPFAFDIGHQTRYFKALPNNIISSGDSPVDSAPHKLHMGALTGRGSAQERYGIEPQTFFSSLKAALLAVPNLSGDFVVGKSSGAGGVTHGDHITVTIAPSSKVVAVGRGAKASSGGND